MEERPIAGFPGYFVTDHGYIISKKSGEPRFLKTWLQRSNNPNILGYENVILCKDGKKHYKLVHRLVAEAFIPNPTNLPEVNHKNHKRTDNCVDNLEWCTQKDNVYDSYSTMSPIRNYRRCTLYDKDGKEIAKFISVTEASRYAHQAFGCSIAGMIRFQKSPRGYYIQKEKCND